MAYSGKNTNSKRRRNGRDVIAAAIQEHTNPGGDGLGAASLTEANPPDYIPESTSNTGAATFRLGDIESARLLLGAGNTKK